MGATVQPVIEAALTRHAPYTAPVSRVEFYGSAYLPRIMYSHDGAATHQMGSIVIGRIVFGLPIFFLGEIRKPGDRPKKSRRDVYAAGSVTGVAKLSTGPDPIRNGRFRTRAGYGQARGVATGDGYRQRGSGFRLAGLFDSLAGSKCVLFARRQDRGLHRHPTGRAK